MLSTWSHWIIIPIVLPLITGAALLLLQKKSNTWASLVSALSTLFGLVVAIELVFQAHTGTIQTYLLSNWSAPFGIVLALDRLSAMMVLLTYLVGGLALLYSSAKDSENGLHFRSLFQFQLMGLNGAFLTGDLFNLFVFFEVLLIASYGLLLHGAGASRLRASVHYVTFNLIGSALFLISASMLYALTGTLNMADMSVKVAQLSQTVNDKTLLLQSSALLLIVVFSVKAALLPLYFWLPATYSAASAPVASFFAIMTKVGVYGILRMTTLVFGEGAGTTAFVVSPWLEWLALGTLLLGAVGAIAAPNLRALVGNLVVCSAGTLLLSVALARPDTVSAGLYYLINSTLVAAGLYLLAGRVRVLRGSEADNHVPGDLGVYRVPLAVFFLLLAVAAAGMPPLAGFLGKAMLLSAVGQLPWAGWIVAVVLTSSFLVIVSFARSGSILFWRPSDATRKKNSLAQSDEPASHHFSWQHKMSLSVTVILLLMLSIFAAPVESYTRATASQLFAKEQYIRSVLSAKPTPAAIDVRREMRERKQQEGVSK
jgi:multicomponent K+:H+ antiporter subunit D